MATQTPLRKRSLPASPMPIEAQLATLESRLVQLEAQVRQAQQVGGLGTAALMLVHEVNNLLTPVFNYAESALTSADEALTRKALRVTATNARMLVATAGRILEIGAAKTSSATLTSIREAVEDARASLCRDLARDGIQFVANVDPAESVWIDPLHLRQVLFNLFLNAREAMAGRHNGLLSVSARRSKRSVLIEVSDTGKGIPEDAVPYVFEPLHTSKISPPNGRPRCAGLGLALCRDLIEEAKGTIQVESAEGRGTTFTITLSDRADTTIDAT